MKKIDWNKFAKAPVNPSRGKYTSYKEFIAKAWQQQEGNKDLHQELRKAIEPQLRQKLADYLINRRPIKVLKSFSIVVDSMQKSGNSVRFEAGTDEIPTGETLVFDHLERTLKQWIFKSNAGKEYEIYDSAKIMYDQGSVVHNTGFYGLLYNTNIYEETLQELSKEEINNG